MNKFGCRFVCILGSVVACLGIGLSTLSPNVPVLMVTYGLIGGFGLGLIYLPATVAVGYYFESKRALATGISVSKKYFLPKSLFKKIPCKKSRYVGQELVRLSLLL